MPIVHSISLSHSYCFIFLLLSHLALSPLFIDYIHLLCLEQNKWVYMYAYSHSGFDLLSLLLLLWGQSGSGRKKITYECMYIDTTDNVTHVYLHFTDREKYLLPLLSLVPLSVYFAVDTCFVPLSLLPQYFFLQIMNTKSL